MTAPRPLPYSDEMFPLCTIPSYPGKRLTIYWGTMMGGLYHYDKLLGYVDVFSDLFLEWEYPYRHAFDTLSKAEAFALDAWGDDIHWIHHDAPDGHARQVTMESFGNELPGNWEEIAESLNSHIYAACVLHPGADPRDVAKSIWTAYRSGDLPSIPESWT